MIIRKRLQSILESQSVDEPVLSFEIAGFFMFKIKRVLRNIISRLLTNPTL